MNQNDSSDAKALDNEPTIKPSRLALDAKWRARIIWVFEFFALPLAVAFFGSMYGADRAFDHDRELREKERLEARTERDDRREEVARGAFGALDRIEESLRAIRMSTNINPADNRVLPEWMKVGYSDAPTAELRPVSYDELAFVYRYGGDEAMRALRTAELNYENLSAALQVRAKLMLEIEGVILKNEIRADSDFESRLTHFMGPWAVSRARDMAFVVVDRRELLGALCNARLNLEYVMGKALPDRFPHRPQGFTAKEFDDCQTRAETPRLITLRE